MWKLKQGQTNGRLNISLIKEVNFMICGCQPFGPKLEGGPTGEEPEN